MLLMHTIVLYHIICIALLISIYTIALHIIAIIQSVTLISRREHWHRAITEPPSTAAYIKQTMMLTTMLLILL